MNKEKFDTVEYFLGIELHPFTENWKSVLKMNQEGILNNIIITCIIKGCNPSTTHKAVHYTLETDAMEIQP